MTSNGVRTWGTVVTSNFEDWFTGVTGFSPHPWQRDLGSADACTDRLLRIPTGFGKTAGAVLAWAYHRAYGHQAHWPMRLVFCLPMRVLVEQTERAIASWFDKAGLKEEIEVVTLLGGRREIGWLERPDRPAVVVGTQDMLLSRAMARGYGSARGLWPMEMGMLHRDTLWVVDEVQLMDVGLATTAQLHAFRGNDEDQGKPALRKSFTWWMSATLQPSWLGTIDLARRVASEPIPTTRIDTALRKGDLWEIRKGIERRADLNTEEEVAALAKERHQPNSLTLVVVNTVERARKVEAALTKAKTKAQVCLIHSRFRGEERSAWSFLARDPKGDAKLPPEGRIIVATQVIEAGVDISAKTLITDLGPWSSLVQRFGRCARYPGETGQVLVVSAVDTKNEKKALPYRLEELAASNDALERLMAAGFDVGARSLEAFEEDLAARDPAALARLYPYEPLHVLRRRDFDDLFDTTPDLSGADLDVSRYIRSGEERDVSVFWRNVEGRPKELRDVVAPAREELCPVPVGELREFLKKNDGYVRDYVDGTWKRVERVIPGMSVLLSAAAGGYDRKRGWDPKSTIPVSPVEASSGSTRPADPAEQAATSSDDDELSVSGWKSIATHGRETGELAVAIGRSLGLSEDLLRVLSLAGRWHDAGKIHDAFQGAIKEEFRATRGVDARRDLAKAPKEAWRKPAYPDRPGFRHELASVLLLFELLRRAKPNHPALVASHEELLAAMGTEAEVASEEERIAVHPLAEEIAALSAEDFDLLAYVVCAHHGKVRTSWSSTPRDQEAEHGDIHGVREGDRARAFALPSAGGAKSEVPSMTLSLACASMGLNGRYGASWGERVAGLLARFGPFSLAYLEAILRAADWRASKLDTPEDA